MHRPFLAPGIETCAHRSEKSATECSGRTGEGRKHALWHHLAAEHVAGRGGSVAFGRCVRPKCPGAGERARVSGCIDGNELAVSDVGRRPSYDPHRLCCRRAECHEVQKLRPERRIGDVLRLPTAPTWARA